MSRGFVMLAQNNDYDYVLQSCLCAMSIHATNEFAKVSLITNDNVPTKYKKYFDKIIPIPWTENKDTSLAKSSSERWKIYHATPYKETIVLDSDMLVLQNIHSWWEFLSNYDLYFVSKTQTYRGDTVHDTYYRKAFIANNLPNLYTGFHYFKKCDKAHEFYRWVELVVNNWELFYGQFVKKHYPKYCTMDVTNAVVAKILNCDTEITNSKVQYPTFTHMKPYIQNWKITTERWQDRVGTYLTPDCKLTIGNHLQTGIFHYVEKDFVTEEKLEIYRNFLEQKND